jgi:hypothetical protein
MTCAPPTAYNNAYSTNVRASRRIADARKIFKGHNNLPDIRNTQSFCGQASKCDTASIIPFEANHRRQPRKAQGRLWRE